MPKFGDYETIDEPIRVTEALGHVSTIWKARHTVTQDSVVYIIKHFALRSETTAAGTPLPLDLQGGDPLQDFVDGVKQLAKAQEKNRQSLAPILASGNSDGEAWYATDYYSRKTLKEFINLQGGVESKALERVVYRIVRGCLALQRSTGRSHGNLKASNVLLAGKPQRLRRTPLHLIDPFPVRVSGIRPVAGPQPPDPLEQIRRQSEKADIRSIGELILQLVEGRIIATAYDYNYPVASSPAWGNLGRDGGLWRQRCNQLLNPQLKLSEINLQSLEDEFRPAAFEARLPRVVAGCIGVTVVAGAVYYTVERSVRKTGVQVSERSIRQEDWGRLVSAAREAGARGDWRIARDMLDQAQHKAQQLNDIALRQQTESELEFAEAMAATVDSLRDGKPEAARQLLEKALQRRPNDAAAVGMKAQVDAAAEEASKQAEFQQLITSARKAELDEQWPRAADLLKQALLRASTLKDPKFRTPAGEELKYVQKMDTAQKFLEDKAHPQLFLAIANAQDALALKPVSTNAAVRLIERARERMRRELVQPNTNPNTPTPERRGGATLVENPTPDPAKQDREAYQRALSAGRTAWNQKEYAEAIRQADAALRIHDQDPEATRLKADAQAAQRYQEAWAAAQVAFSQKDYAEAIRQADVVLSFRNQDPGATKLKADAQAAQGYQAASAAAQVAFSQKDYAEAIRQADVVLSFRNQDPGATKLKADAQAAQGYQAAWTAAQAAWTRRDYAEAIRQADTVLSIRNQDPAATKLKADAQAAQGYQAAWKMAQVAFSQGDYAEAIRQADAVLSVRSQDPQATKLKADSQAVMGYQAARNAAQAAFEQRDYGEAIRQADVALGIRSQDVQAGKIKAAAQLEQSYQAEFKAAQTAFLRGDYPDAIRRSEAALQLKKAETEPVEIIEAAKRQIAKSNNEKELQQKYQDGLSAGRAALERRDYAKAIEQADGVLALKAKDPEASKLKLAAQQEQGYQAATAAFNQGDYGKALGQCQPFKGTDRFDQLTQQIGKEQSQLGGMQKALGEGNYAAILTGPLPRKAAFETLKASASEENRAWQQATQKLTAGDYGFIDNLEQQSYRAKPPFATLLETARKERDLLKSLQALKTNGQRQVLVREYARLPQEVRAKKSFADLAPASDVGASLDPSVASGDKLLETWEIMFGLKPRPLDSTINKADPAKQSSYILKRLDKMEADYEGAGVLDSERKRRLNALRWRVRGGSAADVPGSGQ